MNTITDDQIAEIEHAATEQLEAGLEPGFALALITRLREAERWKADASQVLNPLFDYAHSLGLAKLGHSVTEALIEDHKRLREAERDAARYRWLRDPCSGAERVVLYSRDDFGYGLMSHTMLDAAIDEARGES